MNFLKKIENLATGGDNKSSGTMQHWCIVAERAEGLKDKDTFSKSDPYLKLEFGGKRFNTRVIKNDRSPNWNETFDIKISSQHAGNITVALKDSDIGLDDTIGSAVVPRSDLPSFPGEEKSLKVPLYRKDQVTGIVYLRVKQINDGQFQSSQQSQNTYYPQQQQQFQQQQFPQQQFQQQQFPQQQFSQQQFPQQQPYPQQQYSGFQQSSSSNNPQYNQQQPSFNPNQSQPYDQNQYGQRQGGSNQNYQQQSSNSNYYGRRM